MSELERALVEDRRAPAREPHRRSKPAARAARTASAYPGATTSRFANATIRPGRASRSVGQLAGGDAASMSARDTAVSSAGSSGSECVKRRRGEAQ